MTRTLAALALLLIAALSTDRAFAQIVVGFEEDAPTDRITIINQTACDLVDFDIEIDLRGSAGSLIFDVTEQGAGFNVAQPFGIAEGAQSVIAGTQVLDGDQSVRVSFSQLERGGRVVFTADLDDTVMGGPLGPTMISPDEIAGATAILYLRTYDPVTAFFRNDGAARLPNVYCQMSLLRVD